MEERNKTSLIKISTEQWISIGLEKGWIKNKKADNIKLAFNFVHTLPPPGGYRSVPNSPPETSATSSASTPSEKKESSIFSGFGLSDIAIAALLLRSQNPKIGDADLARMSESMVSNKKEFLEKALASNLITKEQMENYMKTGSLGGEKSATFSRMRNFLNRHRHLIGIAGGSLAGYYGTEYAYNYLANAISPSNEFSKDKINSMSGGISGFMEKNLILMQIARSVLGISKILDSSIGQCLLTIKEIQDKIKS
jgi:hypothetical protein